MYRAASHHARGERLRARPVRPVAKGFEERVEFGCAQAHHNIMEKVLPDPACDVEAVLSLGVLPCCTVCCWDLGNGAMGNEKQHYLPCSNGREVKAWG